MRAGARLQMRCAQAGPSRRGTRATTASRRSSTGSRPRPGARPLPPCRQPTATDACVRCSSSAGPRCGTPCALPASRWRDDASNDDRAHARNRVRLELLPAFRSLHPAADANLLRTAALAGRGRCRARRDRRAAARDGRRPVDGRRRRRPRGRRAARAAPRRRLSGAAPGRGGAGRCARPLSFGRRLGASRRRSRGRAPLRPHRHRARRRRAAAVPGARGGARGARRDGIRRDARALCARRGGRRPGRRSRARARAARTPSRERLPGARRTIARMLLEARVPKPSALATLSSPWTASRWRFRASPSPPPCADRLDSCSP